MSTLTGEAVPYGQPHAEVAARSPVRTRPATGSTDLKSGGRKPLWVRLPPSALAPLTEPPGHVLRVATKRMAAQTLYLPPALGLNAEPGGELALLQQLDQALPVSTQSLLRRRGACTTLFSS